MIWTLNAVFIFNVDNCYAMCDSVCMCVCAHAHLCVTNIKLEILKGVHESMRGQDLYTKRCVCEREREREREVSIFINSEHLSLIRYIDLSVYTRSGSLQREREREREREGGRERERNKQTEREREIIQVHPWDWVHISMFISCQGSPRVLVANGLNSDIVVSKFELQSRYYVHFQTKILEKGMNPILPQSICFIAPLHFFYKDGFAIK